MVISRAISSKALKAFPKILGGFPESLLETYRGFPVQKFPRPGNVRLPYLRVVHRQGVEGDAALAPGQLQDQLGRLEDGFFIGIADIHRFVEIGPEEPIQPLHQVGDVAEAAGLLAVPVDGEASTRPRKKA